MIGQTISHFKILEKLGEGGMGVVYKAEDTNLDRMVALKFLPPHLNASGPDKARFVQEAKAAAALNHPNVCSVIEISEHDGRMFMVMEFVDGQTLREKKESITLKQTVDIGIQIADGLSAAHEKGIVHRDIKPENIMIRKDGIAQIMDFGLAKLRSASSKINRLTKEGSTVGTAGYMSPEQVQGQDADHRSDIFSLGVLLYELFTGQLPFKGVHETAVAYEIVNVDPAPMTSVKPDIDPSLDAIVLECLAKEPDERTQSAKQVSVDLKRYRRESSRQRATRTMSTRQFQKPEIAEASPAIQAHASPKQVFWPSLSVALAIAAVLFAWSPWRPASTPKVPVMCFPINLPLTAPLVAGSTTVAISPDGKSIVYLAAAGGIPKLFLRPMDQFTAKPVPGTDGANDPFFSPDGQWIGFFVNGKLNKASIFGGAPQFICDIPGFMRGAWWTSDNSIWYGHINSAIFRVPAGGGVPVEVTRVDSAGGEISHRFPQPLPDGKTVIFTIKHNNISTFDDAVIAAENVETHERKILVRGGSYGRYVPTGHLMYARGSSLFAVPFDAEKVEVKGPPLQVLDGGMLSPISGNANFSYSSNGTLVYVPLGSVSELDGTLAWLDQAGMAQPLLDTVRPYANGSLSPDGERIAMDIRAANDDVWVYDLKRGTLTRFTFGGGNSDYPQWMPDGKRILYYSERGRSIRLFWKASDGSGSEEAVGDAIGLDGASPPAISPDGKLLVYCKKGDLWIMPLDKDGKSRLFFQSAAVELYPSFSPDGHWLSYSSNESGPNEVYVVPFPARDGKYQISTNGGRFARWLHNGTMLIYSEGRKLMTVDVRLSSRFDFSHPRKLLDLPPSVGAVWHITPDGKHFLVALNKSRDVNASQVNVVVGWFDELRKQFSGNK